MKLLGAILLMAGVAIGYLVLVKKQTVGAIVTSATSFFTPGKTQSTTQQGG